jgi:hypothetical protein
MVIGGLGGVVLAVTAFLTLRKTRALRWEWRHAKWFRLLTLVFWLVVCPILLAKAGMAEGILRGSERILQQSWLGRVGFPAIGSQCADLVFSVHLSAPRWAKGEWEVVLLEQESKQFVADQYLVDVPEFLQRLDMLTEKAVDKGCAQTKSQIMQQSPAWQGGVREGVLDLILYKIVKPALLSKKQQALREYGVEPFFDQLTAEAARLGNQKKMSRSQLADFFVQRVIVIVDPENWTTS